MPCYYFDLLVNGHPHTQGGMILENLAIASDRADALASELRILNLNFFPSRASCALLTKRIMNSTERLLAQYPVGRGADAARRSLRSCAQRRGALATAWIWSPWGSVWGSSQ